MINIGAIGCIITKSFLDSVHKDIEESINVQIISVIGARTAPLEKMLKVGVKIGKFEIKENMIVTESFGYNILLGNNWITIQAKIDPKVFTPIDFVEEKYDELELEEIYENPQYYLNVSFNNNMTTINSQQYLTEFLKFSKLELLKTNKYWKGLERCLSVSINKAQIKANDKLIEISKGKETPIRKLTKDQQQQLQQLLEENKDLFANEKSELTQTNISQYEIITENMHPIKRRPYTTSLKEKEWIASEIEEMLEQEVIRPSNSPCYEVKYRKEKYHENADALSWINPYDFDPIQENTSSSPNSRFFNNR
ncbi:4450_t:CDS:2 [Funneliformis caledonium]|uniref:4450_t:CDS:1 n=1 Tax=Funneliformis caledonium TaxID=1117310 RepID=A0A9N9CWF1_9GLOM|nr:4450_t:CDS:2 [Funneliformis caledonium]